MEAVIYAFSVNLCNVLTSSRVDNGSAVLRVDKSIHARLSPQDSALVVYRKPRHHQLLARLLCYMDKQLFLITKDRTDLFIF